MLFKSKMDVGQYDQLVENIKRDLVSTFQVKGIILREVRVDAKSGKLNISVCIQGKK
ncbi:MAG: hypothetical protein QHH06_05245 [Clostridiales bacterium]|jgi:hypothetical protein|nr:hypothetical protein [Eubacteriales bacterium]MDH7565872.1 hypothetical protein [Clostridiales bacterium]